MTHSARVSSVHFQWAFLMNVDDEAHVMGSKVARRMSSIAGLERCEGVAGGRRLNIWR